MMRWAIIAFLLYSSPAWAADTPPRYKLVPEEGGWWSSTVPDLTSAGTVTGTSAAFTGLVSCATLTTNASGDLICSSTSGSGDITDVNEGLAIDVTNSTGPAPTVAFDPTELTGSRTWGDGSTDTIVWTVNRASGTDPTWTFGSGTVTGQAVSFTSLISCAALTTDAAGNVICSGVSAGSGTVTSISQGTNMSFSVNPITSTGTINLTASPSVTNLTASNTVTGTIAVDTPFLANSTSTNRGMVQVNDGLNVTGTVTGVLVVATGEPNPGTAEGTITVKPTFTQNGEEQNAVMVIPIVRPAGASTQSYVGVNAIPTVPGVNVSNASVAGVAGGPALQGGTTGNALGIYGLNQLQNDAVATNSYALYADNPNLTGTSSVGTNYGLFVADQTSGTVDVGAALLGADTATLVVGAGADNTDAPNGIFWGTSLDTNLYRGAANQLKTDDSIVASAGTVTGQVVVATQQLLAQAGSVVSLPSYKHVACGMLENLVAADDNLLLFGARVASTVTDVFCRTSSFTTQPTLSFEDDSGNAMTGAPTCSAGGQYAAVTAGGGLVAGEAVRVDVTNTTAPLTGTQALICLAYTEQ